VLRHCLVQRRPVTCPSALLSLSHIYIYIYRERERERASERARGRERNRKRARASEREEGGEEVDIDCKGHVSRCRIKAPVKSSGQRYL
jgi:hypothetical protein